MSSDKLNVREIRGRSTLTTGALLIYLKAEMSEVMSKPSAIELQEMGVGVYHSGRVDFVQEMTEALHYRVLNT